MDVYPDAKFCIAQAGTKAAGWTQLNSPVN